MPRNTYRFVSYVRDMTAQRDKFRQFDRLVADAKRRAEVDAVLVTSPEVLGDTYDEVIMNLNKLADARWRLWSCRRPTGPR